MSGPRFALLVLCGVSAVGCGLCEEAPSRGERAASPSGPDELQAVSRAVGAAGQRTCVLRSSDRIACAEAGASPASRVHVPGAEHLAVGDRHTCVATDGGEVWCWGSNDHGQLGDGSREDATAPVRVGGLESAVGVTAGAAHTCARLKPEGDDPEVRCWGDNRRGQLGDGTITVRTRPVRVEGLPEPTAVDAGHAHTCARSTDGSVRCWGGFAQLEDVPAEAALARDPAAFVAQLPEPATTPRRVPLREPVLDVAAGGTESCAVLTGGDVACWSAFVGDGLETRDVVWVTDAVEVESGGWVSCALLRGGTVACWNERAVEPGAARRAAPGAVRGIEGAIEIAVGADHACARDGQGALLCWHRGSERPTRMQVF